MVKTRTTFLLSMFAASASPLAGCAGAPPPSAETADADTAGSSGPRGPSMGYQAEIGALDEGKVQETFNRVSSKLSACFAKGAQRIPYIAGSVSFKVRVAEDGSARWAYLKDSTLGDRATEECMISALKSASWPKPIGGEGLAGNDDVSFDPGGDERPPVAWSPEQLGDDFKKAQPTLSQCRDRAGTGPVKATFYVETDGRPRAIGASSADEKGDEAIRCIIDTLNELTFPSPGSYAAKVSVVID